MLLPDPGGSARPFSKSFWIGLPGRFAGDSLVGGAHSGGSRRAQRRLGVSKRLSEEAGGFRAREAFRAGRVASACDQRAALLANGEPAGERTRPGDQVWWKRQRMARSVSVSPPRSCRAAGSWAVVCNRVGLCREGRLWVSIVTEPELPAGRSRRAAGNGVEGAFMTPRASTRAEGSAREERLERFVGIHPACTRHADVAGKGKGKGAGIVSRAAPGGVCRSGRG